MPRSARQTSRGISEGSIPPQYLGEKNYYVVRQELTSLLNEKHAIRTDAEQAEFESYVAGAREYTKGLNGGKLRTIERLISLLENSTEDEVAEAVAG